jgi:thiol-disulfide isomerase/thioredoxin
VNVRRRSIVLASLATIAGAWALVPRGTDAPRPALEPVPHLPIVDLEGKPAALDRYRGRLLVLNVWATWCGPCRRELPSLDRLRERLPAERFAVAALAVDSDRLSVAEYLRAKGLGLEGYVSEDHGRVYAALTSRALPQTLLVRRDGMIVERIVGAREWDSPEAIRRVQAAAAG